MNKMLCQLYIPAAAAKPVLQSWCDASNGSTIVRVHVVVVV
jgi:hypothetical protein